MIAEKPAKSLRVVEAGPITSVTKRKPLSAISSLSSSAVSWSEVLSLHLLRLL